MSNTTAGFSQDEIDVIFANAAEVDAQVDAIHAHLDATGTVIPMRTLGADEETVLNQRHLIAQARMEQADEEVARNVQVTIIDADDNAVNLATDVARRAMMDVNLPVGPTTPVALGGFEGDYLVDLPKSWWDALAESGDDFWAETGDLIVTVTVP